MRIKATNNDILSVISEMVTEGRKRAVNEAKANSHWHGRKNNRQIANEAYNSVMSEANDIYDPVTYASEQQHIADITGEENDEAFKDALAAYDFRVNPDAVYPEEKAIDNEESWELSDRNDREDWMHANDQAYDWEWKNGPQLYSDPVGRLYHDEQWDDDDKWKGHNGIPESINRSRVRRVVKETLSRLCEASGRNKVEDALAYLDSLENDPEERKKFAHSLKKSIDKANKKRRQMGESIFDTEQRPEGDDYDPWMNGDASWINGKYQNVCGYANVEINTSLSYVDIMPIDGNEENEYFLQGDDADQAIREICRIYHNGDVTQDQAVAQWLSHSGY